MRATVLWGGCCHPAAEVQTRRCHGNRAPSLPPHPHIHPLAVVHSDVHTQEKGTVTFLLRASIRNSFWRVEGSSPCERGNAASVAAEALGVIVEL